MNSSHSQLAIGFIAIAMLVSCSQEESAQAPGKSVSTPTSTVQDVTARLAVLAPQPCEAGQPVIETGYQNFPGKQCSEIARLIESSYTTRIGYRKQCQKLTGASKRPKSVARVQVNECGPLKQQAGNYASMRVCCATPIPVTNEKVLHYQARPACPANNVQALATDLHYPAKQCDQAVISAESSLTISAYQKACMTAAGNTQVRQSILDAAVISCREGAGAVVDVAVCCSAQLPAGQSIDALNATTDLWEILRKSDLFALQLLLSREPGRAHERGEQHITPLHRAGNLAITNALLKNKADLEARDADGATPLHYAVRGRLDQVVARLLDAGAKVDAMTNNGDTPLSFAPNKTIAELLLSHQASPDGGGSASPLHSAAFYGRLGVAELLIAHGADLNRLDSNGETPLHRAAFRQKKELVRLLIQKGAAINLRSSSGRPRTALDMTDNPEIRALIRSQGGVGGN